MSRRTPSRVLLCCLCAGALGACDSGGGGGGGSSANAEWHVVRSELPGALLSIWMSAPNNVWATGADPGDGKGPMIVHVVDGQPSRVENDFTGNLWWVFSRDAKTLFFVGGSGLILRYDTATKTFTPITSPAPEATLFGIWGAPGGPLYAVGGYLAPGDDRPGVILKVEGDTATEVAGVPQNDIPKEMYFKVWGSAANDMWVIGDWGRVMHFDGASWTAERLTDSPRLVTIHGGGPADAVIVGGRNTAEIFQNGGSGWSDNLAPENTTALNGVYVSASGRAAAAGMRGNALIRDDGQWSLLPVTPKVLDWHGVWVDSGGDVWVVGGNLQTADALNNGAILRYGE